MKGQMFILTIIFLIGLIYTVQQSLSSYSTLDFSEPFREDDFYVFTNMRDIYEYTAAVSENCNDARDNLNELTNYIGTKIIFGGYIFDINYIHNCLRWDNTEPDPAPLNLTIKTIGGNSESFGTFEIYHRVPPKIYFAKHENIDPSLLCLIDVSDPSVVVTSRIEELNGDGLNSVVWTGVLSDSNGVQVDSIIDNPLFDDGNIVNGDRVAGDNIYSGVYNSPCADVGGCTLEGTVEACDVDGCTNENIWCVD